MGGPPLKTSHFDGIRNSRVLKLKFIYLSKKMHPDRCFELGAEEKHAQGILFARMVEDYNHLRDLDLTKVDYIMLRRPVLDDECSDDEGEPEEKQSTTKDHHRSRGASPDLPRGARMDRLHAEQQPDRHGHLPAGP